MSKKRTIGIVGYGKLGQYLSDAILNDPEVGKKHELSFVWNRTFDKIGDEIPKHKRLKNLAEFTEKKVDLIVEVADKTVNFDYGYSFLMRADYMLGSATAFANKDFYNPMKFISDDASFNGLYIPRGAMPGLDDILRKKGEWVKGGITMKKHPDSINYLGDIDLSKIDEETILYSGPLRELCTLAPNNVNTMAVFALSSGLGFDEVQAKLIADPDLDEHIIESLLLHKTGYWEEHNKGNPAAPGATTGQATFKSFLDSMVNSYGAGKGIHFR